MRVSNDVAPPRAGMALTVAVVRGSALLRRWLTAPEARIAGRMGLFRIIYAAFYIWHLSWVDAAALGLLPDAVWQPVGVLRLVPARTPSVLPGVIESVPGGGPGAAAGGPLRPIGHARRPGARDPAGDLPPELRQGRTREHLPGVLHPAVHADLGLGRHVVAGCAARTTRRAGDDAPVRRLLASRAADARRAAHAGPAVRERGRRQRRAGHMAHRARPRRRPAAGQERRGGPRGSASPRDPARRSGQPAAVARVPVRGASLRVPVRARAVGWPPARRRI